MDWGDVLSQDFYETIPAVTDKPEWYQCRHCRADLRSGKHRIDCGLLPVGQEEEAKRVSFIISTFKMRNGITVYNGGKNG
jgi:hypothetical protein